MGISLPLVRARRLRPWQSTNGLVNGIVLEVDLDSPLSPDAERALRHEIDLHHNRPLRGTLGPMDLEVQPDRVDLLFPRFDAQVRRLEETVEVLRPRDRAAIARDIEALERGARRRRRTTWGPLWLGPGGAVAMLGPGTPAVGCLLGISSKQESPTECARRLGLKPGPEAAAAAAVELSVRTAFRGLPQGSTRGPHLLVEGGTLASRTAARPPQPPNAGDWSHLLGEDLELDAEPPARAPPSVAPTPVSYPSPRGVAEAHIDFEQLKREEPRLPVVGQPVWFAIVAALFLVAALTISRARGRIESRTLAPMVDRTNLRSPDPKPPATAEPRDRESPRPGEPAERAPAAAPQASRFKASPSEPSKRRSLSLISIMSQPSGASVFVDDVLLGETPLVVRRPLEARPHEVRIQAEGHRIWRRRVEPKDGSISLVAKLKPRGRR